MKGREAVPAGRFWVEGYEAVLDGKFWVEVTRESFRWRILGEGARGSASRSASAVSKSSLLFVRAEKSARSLELPAATRIGIYVKLEACQARTGGIQFQRSFSGTFQAAGLLQMQNTPDWNTQRPMAHHSQRFATHDPSPQTMVLAGVFEFAKNSWQEAESRSTLSIAGHSQGARCLPCCHRAACASEASWPRMTAMEADAGGAGWEACQMDCIPPSASALFPVSSKK